MKKLLQLLPFALLLFLGTSCDPDDLTVGNSGVYGVVFDETTQRPVSGASIFINGPDSHSTVTDVNGNYRFENMPLGSYTLSAQKERYIAAYEDVELTIAGFEKADIYMAPETMLSTHELDFGTNIDELDIVVTNHLDEAIDIKVDENHMWLNTQGIISGLEPGQSETIKVTVFRPMLQQSSYSVPLILNVEEDFGFEILESYTVTVNVQQ